MRFSFKLRQQIIGALPPVVLAVVLVLFVGFKADADSKTVLGLAGGIAAAYAFIYKQSLDDTRFFRELFREFNERFEKKNQALNGIRERANGDPAFALEPGDTDTLMDYFNLCAEEYLYFKSGFIDPEVWQSWLAGMRYFAACPKIRAVWENDLRQQGNAYYGFNLGLLDNTSNCPDHG